MREPAPREGSAPATPGSSGSDPSGSDPSGLSAHGPSAAEGRTRRALAAAGFASLFASLFVFGAIAEDIHEREAIALDTFATPWLHQLSSPALDGLMRAITALGSTAIVAPLFVVAVAALLLRRHWRDALFLAVSIAGSVALNESLKLFFHRERPQLAWAAVQPDFSFPSGHAMNGLVFYVALAAIAWRLWGARIGSIAMALAVGLAVLIGTSRIYLGYHYLSDVAGGFLAGAAWLIVVAAAFDGRLRRFVRNRRATGTTGVHNQLPRPDVPGRPQQR